VIARLNLSSHPFRNRTLPWTTAAAVSLVSLLVIVYVLTETSRARAQADLAERNVARMREERTAIEAKAKEVRQEIPRDQLEVLNAAHALVDRKSFSWSQLFADLEAVMPQTVRVQRIGVSDVVQQGGETRAELEMVVVGKAPENVTGMMAAMARTGGFTVTPVSENFKEGGYEWSLRVGYVQRVRRSGGGEGQTVASVPAAVPAEGQR
jgi:Tfp pilus assembly protein PilN